MTNPNATKGAKWERDVRDFLREWFDRHTVTRPRQEGFGDVGDIHVSPFIVQAKDATAASLGAWMDSAKAQAGRAGERYAVVAWKRRGKGAKAGFVTMELEAFRELAWRLREAESELRRVHSGSYMEYVNELERRRA